VWTPGGKREEQSGALSRRSFHRPPSRLCGPDRMPPMLTIRVGSVPGYQQ